MEEINVTDIEDIEVGHAHNLDAGTGCTVVICEKGAVAGIDVRGGAPGTRESDLLDPVNLVEKIHAVVLAGGSAFGLDAASGVMQYLEERTIGFDVQVTRVPIVCGAVLFDLAIGDHSIRPDKKMGYQACLNAANGGCPESNVGAGTGATVGKIMGMARAMKGGLGCYADKKNLFAGNTTIGIVATNAKLTESQSSVSNALRIWGAIGARLRQGGRMPQGEVVFHEAFKADGRNSVANEA